MVWIIEFNIAFVVEHLVGMYLVMTRPIYAYVECRAAAAWPSSALVRERDGKVVQIMAFSVSSIQLVWRTTYVFMTTVVAILLPFFRSVEQGSTRWLLQHVLSTGAGVVEDLKAHNPFFWSC